MAVLSTDANTILGAGGPRMSGHDVFVPCSQLPRAESSKFPASPAVRNSRRINHLALPTEKSLISLKFFEFLSCVLIVLGYTMSEGFRVSAWFLQRGRGHDTKHLPQIRRIPPLHYSHGPGRHGALRRTLRCLRNMDNLINPSVRCGPSCVYGYPAPRAMPGPGKRILLP